MQQLIVAVEKYDYDRFKRFPFRSFEHVGYTRTSLITNQAALNLIYIRVHEQLTEAHSRISQTSLGFKHWLRFLCKKAGTALQVIMLTYLNQERFWVIAANSY